MIQEELKKLHYPEVPGSRREFYDNAEGGEGGGEGGSGGSASYSYVMDWFQTGSTSDAQEDVTIPYTGKGYPIAGYVIRASFSPLNSTIPGGVVSWSFIKDDFNTAPTFSGNYEYRQTDDLADGASVIYAENNKNPNSYFRQSSAYCSQGSSGQSAPGVCACFKDNKTFSYSIAHSSAPDWMTDYGFYPDSVYNYYLIYLEK